MQAGSDSGQPPPGQRYRGRKLLPRWMHLCDMPDRPFCVRQGYLSGCVGHALCALVNVFSLEQADCVARRRRDILRNPVARPPWPDPLRLSCVSATLPDPILSCVSATLPQTALWARLCMPGRSLGWPSSGPAQLCLVSRVCGGCCVQSHKPAAAPRECVRVGRRRRASPITRMFPVAPSAGITTGCYHAHIRRAFRTAHGIEVEPKCTQSDCAIAVSTGSPHGLRRPESARAVPWGDDIHDAGALDAPSPRRAFAVCAGVLRHVRPLPGGCCCVFPCPPGRPKQLALAPRSIACKLHEEPACERRTTFQQLVARDGSRCVCCANRNVTRARLTALAPTGTLSGNPRAQLPWAGPRGGVAAAGGGRPHFDGWDPRDGWQCRGAGRSCCSGGGDRLAERRRQFLRSSERPELLMKFR